MLIGFGDGLLFFDLQVVRLPLHFVGFVQVCLMTAAAAAAAALLGRFASRQRQPLRFGLAFVAGFWRGDLVVLLVVTWRTVVVDVATCRFTSQVIELTARLLR